MVIRRPRACDGRTCTPPDGGVRQYIISTPGQRTPARLRPYAWSRSWGSGHMKTGLNRPDPGPGENKQKTRDLGSGPRLTTSCGCQVRSRDSKGERRLRTAGSHIKTEIRIVERNKETRKIGGYMYVREDVRNGIIAQRCTGHHSFCTRMKEKKGAATELGSGDKNSTT